MDSFNDISEFDPQAGLTKSFLRRSPDCRMILITESIIIIPKYWNTDCLIDNKNNLYNIMLHEIGHSIGLYYHSRNKKSIMYAEVGKDNKITNEEIARLQKLYKFKLD